MLRNKCESPACVTLLKAVFSFVSHMKVRLSSMQKAGPTDTILWIFNTVLMALLR